MAKEKVLGIDLGTTFSCMSIMEAGKPIVIPNSEGGRTTASVVAFTKEGERLVGSLAKRQAVTNPQRTIQSIKRKMGTSEKINIDGKGYTPQEISAMILQKLKIDAEAYLGEKIAKSVITVPAYFNDAQRQATKDAGKIAGLEVLRIINEPTASALAYGIDKEHDVTVLVYDLGGGTFDVSILTLGDGVFEVKSTAGNNHLGGDDFDKRITDYLIEEFRKKEGVDLKNDPYAMQRLRDASENAKIELSQRQSTNINLPYITTDASGPKFLNIDLTRAKLEQLIGDLVELTVGPVQQALSDAKLEPKDIDHVLLVRGVDAGAARAGDREESPWKRTGQGSQPRRVRCTRCRYPGSGSDRGDQGYRPPGRYTPYARYRDPWRYCNKTDRTQYHDPNAEKPDILDCR